MKLTFNNMILTPEQFKAKYGGETTTPTVTALPTFNPAPQAEPEKPGFFKSVRTKLGERAGDIKEAVVADTAGELAGTQVGSQARLLLRGTGAVAGAFGDILFEGLRLVAPQFVEDALSKGVEKVAETDVVQKLSSNYSEWAKANPQAAQDLSDAFNIAAVIPALKGVNTVGKVVGTAAKVASKGLKTVPSAIGRGLQVSGALTEKAGKGIVAATLPPKNIAGKLLSYRARTPFKNRLKQTITGVGEAPPVTPADVLVKYGLGGLKKAGIGEKAKRVADRLFSTKVKPALSNIKDKITKATIFSSIERKISKIKDISQRKSLLNALEAMADDYKHVSSWSARTLDDIKSSMANRLPSKVWKGQDIAGDMNNVRKMFSDEARNIIRNKLPKNIVEIYDDYGSLKEIIGIGVKATGTGMSSGVFGMTSQAIKTLTTPITTLGGTGVSKIGTGLKNLGTKLK